MQDFREHMAAAFKRVRRRQNLGNITAAVRFTTRWMHVCGLVIAPFDKESGVCLIRAADLVQVEEQVLTSDFYEPVVDDLNDLQNTFRAEYCRLAHAVQRLEGDERLGGTLRRSLNCSRASYSATLMVTLKAHKRPPLTWRNIHRSGAPVVYGLSAWLVEQLKPLTAALPLLLDSTDEFVSDLRGIRAETGMKMYRADVMEFFMSGSQEILEECTVSWMPDGPRKTCVSTVLRWLLKRQYVCTNDVDPRTWRDVRGSGMGFKHSSHVADLFFFRTTR